MHFRNIILMEVSENSWSVGILKKGHPFGQFSKFLGKKKGHTIRKGGLFCEEERF